MGKLDLIPKYNLLIEEAPIQNFRLKRARIEKGFTGKDLAEKVGISTGSYFGIEELRSYPSKEIKNKITKKLDQDSEYLFPERFREYSTKKSKGESHSQDVFDNLKKVKVRFTRIEDSVDYEKTADESMDLINLNHHIMRLLKTLTFRGGEIIKDRFGFGTTVYTLREASKKYKICPDRIRQIEAKAIRKSQHPVRAMRLVEFYKDLIGEF